ncbi:MAG: alpha/beta fold hydrolase [Minisyncoccia bacterium]|jgi:pimeloyl-ACP methyl ester carboxylesterase
MKLVPWVRDYIYAAKGHGLAFLSRKPPAHYLGYIEKGRAPVVLIPGIYTKWHFLKAIADPLSNLGHPIYVVDKLGYNTKGIPDAAKLVRELIDEKNLQNVIIIAHSKGGLVGKYLLAKYNNDSRVRKMIAVATPFGGSRLAHFIPHRSAKELAPESEIIRELEKEENINRLIVSVFGLFDNHVRPTLSCRLEGAKNIQIPVYGHHKILFSRETLKTVLEEIE